MNKRRVTLGVLLTVPLFAPAVFGAAGGPPAGVPHGPPPFAGPPAGVRMGPPAGVPAGPAPIITRGPPPHALANIPAGTPAGQALAASELGRLNAAHASSRALSQAAPNSAVGVIAIYQTQMTDALALVDLTARDAAITAAREQLALASNKQLTPSAVTRIDNMLGIEGAPPDLGTTP